jgi:hypothetical protein
MERAYNIRLSNSELN